jgi:hypothetical protein
MDDLNKKARFAGVMYLLLMVAPLRLMYIPDVLFVTGNPAATAANIASHERLFRLGIVSDLLAGIFGLLLTLALYRLFKDVDQELAVLMVILGGLMVTPIYFVNTTTDAGALLFARGTDFLSVFNQPQREAMTTLFLRLHHHGVLVNEVFWGLWLFPFGLLVYKSRFIPRILGVWLIINGFAYVIASFTGLLAPQYESAVFNSLFPALLGEVAIMLWLLIRGARPLRVGGAKAPAAA